MFPVCLTYNYSVFFLLPFLLYTLPLCFFSLPPGSVPEMSSVLEMSHGSHESDV